MGSHGGATADGQRAMLAELGMTEDALGAEIRSTMETEVVARTRRRPARSTSTPTRPAADRILPVNRIKPHTAFRGPIESGCTKMAVVGFGKQPGAAQFHAEHGAVGMRDRLLAGIAALRGDRPAARRRRLGRVAVRRRRHGPRAAGRRRRRRRPSGR